MASACVNNLPTTYSNTHNTNWFTSPRTSVSHDFNNSKNEQKISTSSKSDLNESSSSSTNNNNNAADFNFQLGSNTVTMLPADELFSDGKLLPLHLSSQKPPQLLSKRDHHVAKAPTSSQQKELERVSESDNPYLFSPKAPRCSSRWKELLGLKKTSVSPSSTTSAAAASNNSGNVSGSGRSIRQLLNRNSKTSSTNSSMSLPLLKDYTSVSSSSSSSSLSSSVIENEAKDNNVNSSSRLSLSSSSSSSHDELPRLSLDTEKPNNNQQDQPKRSLSTGPRMRPVRPRTRKKEAMTLAPTTMGNPTTVATTRGVVTIESPRMGPSGRVVFESLERSSSCPSSFNGGLRYNNNSNKGNYKGVMERSYSGNVNARITPVLNVPVCSLRGSSKFGFGHLFSSQSQKKEGSNNNNNNNGGNNYVKNFNNHTSSKINNHTSSKIKDKIKDSS